MKIKAFISFALLCSSAFALQVCLVVSQYTPSSLINDLTKSGFDVVVWPASFPPGRIQMVIDFTQSEFYSFQLAQASKVDEFLLFQLSPPAKWQSDWQFFLHPATDSDVQALHLLTKTLGWDSYHVIGTIESLDSAHSFVQASLGSVVSSSFMTASNFELYCFKAVKTSGNWKSVVLSSSAEAFVSGLKAAKIYKVGCGLIVSRYGAWGTFEAGTVALVETGLEGSSSYLDYEIKAIQHVIATLDSSWTTLNEELLARAKAAFPSRVVFTKYSVLNYYSETGFDIVGSIENELVELSGVITYPGGVTSIPTDKPQIQFSGTTSIYNLDGSLSPFALQVNMGLTPMLHIVNSDDSILPNFELKLYDTDCGCDIFEFEYFLECYTRHLPSLGVFLLSSTFESVLAGSMEVLRSLGSEIPVLTGIARDPSLADKQLFPEIIIPEVPHRPLYSLLPRLLPIFDWRQCVVIFDEGVTEGVYEDFFHAAESLGIDILNDHQYQLVKYRYSKEEFDEANLPLVEHLIATKARVIINFATGPTESLLASALYDFGLRRGDVLFLTIYRPSYLFHELEDVVLEAVYELLDGSLILVTDEFLYEYGEFIQVQIAEAIAPYPTTYTSYDINALLIGANAIDMMLRLGKDYEDPWLLNEYVRLQRFTGVSGKVSIDQSGNMRGEMTYQLYNVVVGEEFHEKRIGSYTVGIVIPLVFEEDIHWPNGGTSPPEAIRHDPVCGFKDTERIENQASVCLTSILLGAVSLLTFLLPVVLWKFFFTAQWPTLTERVEIMFEDALTMLMAVFEAVEIASFASTFTILHPLVEVVSNSVELNLMLLFTLEFEAFWTQIYLLLGFGVTWVVCFWVEIFRLKRFLPSECKSVVHWLGLKIGAVVPHVGLLFILFFTVKLLQCPEGTSEELEDSFLANDCLTSCWTGSHLFWAIFSCVFLVVFALTAVVARPASDITFMHVNIRVTPLFWVMKSYLLVLLTFVHSLVPSQGLFEYLYLGICVCLLVGSLVIQPYNYGRMNLWQRIIFVMLVLNALLNCGFEKLGSGEREYVIIGLSSVFLLIAAGGVVIQVKKYPNILFRVPGRPLEHLFLFMANKRSSIDPERGNSYIVPSNSNINPEVEFN